VALGLEEAHLKTGAAQATGSGRASARQGDTMPLFRVKRVHSLACQPAFCVEAPRLLSAAARAGQRGEGHCPGEPAGGGLHPAGSVRAITSSGRSPVCPWSPRSPRFPRARSRARTPVPSPACRKSTASQLSRLATASGSRSRQSLRWSQTANYPRKTASFPSNSARHTALCHRSS